MVTTPNDLDFETALFAKQCNRGDFTMGADGTLAWCWNGTPGRMVPVVTSRGDRFVIGNQSVQECVEKLERIYACSDCTMPREVEYSSNADAVVFVDRPCWPDCGMEDWTWE